MIICLQKHALKSVVHNEQIYVSLPVSLRLYVTSNLSCRVFTSDFQEMLSPSGIGLRSSMIGDDGPIKWTMVLLKCFTFPCLRNKAIIIKHLPKRCCLTSMAKYRKHFRKLYRITFFIPRAFSVVKTGARPSINLPAPLPFLAFSWLVLLGIFTFIII